MTAAEARARAWHAKANQYNSLAMIHVAAMTTPAIYNEDRRQMAMDRHSEAAESYGAESQLWSALADQLEKDGKP